MLDSIDVHAMIPVQGLGRAKATEAPSGDHMYWERKSRISRAWWRFFEVAGSNSRRTISRLQDREGHPRDRGQGGAWFKDGEGNLLTIGERSQ